MESGVWSQGGVGEWSRGGGRGAMSPQSLHHAAQSASCVMDGFISPRAVLALCRHSLNWCPHRPLITLRERERGVIEIPKQHFGAHAL